MSDAPQPERPRLADWVQARMHVAGGLVKVILHDVSAGRIMEIAPDDWRVLEHADGTRDLDGLVLACAKGGRHVREADIVQLLGELHAAGVLMDGLAPPALEVPVPVPLTPDDLPLDVLPDFALVCDGRGSCCRFYGSVAFQPAEALRARALASDMDRRGLDDAHLFLPVHGSEAIDPNELLAVAQVDGRCFFLDDETLCGIHRRAGVEAKPFACRAYPATFVDDGVALRVSLGPECACIFASVGTEGGDPLVPVHARTRGDLDPRIGVMHVPDPVPLGATKTATREALHGWSRALHDRLRGFDGDAARLVWALARQVEVDGLSSVVIAPAALDGIEPWLVALRTRAALVADTHEGWRGASDLSRAVARWIAEALLVVDPDLAPVDPGAERFYLAAMAFGHRLVVEGRPLAHGLRDRAARLLAARAMARVAPPDDTSAAHPLALLEAAMRNLGIAGYMDG